MARAEDFKYQNEKLYCEGVALEKIVAAVGSPVYVYSKNTIRKNIESYKKGFENQSHQLCFAVKALTNGAVLKTVEEAGAGFDIVSGGELFRVISAGCNPKRVVFSGVGKTDEEIIYALENEIHCFNVESHQEIERMKTIALRREQKIPISLRVNPNIDPKTHPYISTGLKKNKFGIAFQDVLELYKEIQESGHFQIKGIACHIGSQITESDPFKDALNKVLDLVSQIEREGIMLDHIDLGGGLGIVYQEETPPSPESLVKILREALGPENCSKYTLCLEPGRSIVGESGALLTQVIDIKPTELKNFAVVDAAMNDLLRPALYSGFHEVWALNESEEEKRNYDIVGPICETGDFLAQDRDLAPLSSGDVVAIMSTGAYGMEMASNYNSRPKCAEVLVDGDSFFLIRKRETLQDIIRTECFESLA